MKRILSAFMSVILFSSGTALLSVNAAASPDTPVIVAFGDSITASGAWFAAINSRFGFNIINAGIGGNNTSDAKLRFSTDVLKKNPDIVIICFGMNDSALDMAKHIEINAFKDNLRYFITTLKEKGIKVILATPNHIEESLYYTRHDSSVFAPVGGAAAYVDSYCEAIRAVADEQGVYLADIRASCDNYPNRLSVVTDGVHPTTLGYSLYSALIGEQITKIYLGDANRDGKINAADYLLIKRHFLGSYTIPQTHLSFADVDGDGEIRAKDYLALKRYFLGTHNIFKED